MSTTSIGIRGIGLIVGIVSAVLALVVLLSDDGDPVRGDVSRYEGWDDSLGI